MFKNLQFYQKVIVLLWLGFGAGNFAQAATDCNQVTEIPVSECQSLLELYNSTNGANWTNNTGWNQTNNPCSWFGVVCYGRYVYQINLGLNGLKGSLPNFNFPSLQLLHLESNQLIGDIPDFNLPNLQGLFLGKNQFSGSIPDFSNLPNLQGIYFSENQLSGSIPDFSNLPNLVDLVLFSNRLIDTIPNFTSLPNLGWLNLGENRLTGNIPDFNLPNLIYLALYDNQLKGSIPNFANLSNLRKLYLYANQLIGNVPNFSTSPELIEIHLGQNRLTGGIPDFNLPKLTGLNLSSNQLSGNIPSFPHLPSLTELYLSLNQLSGAIPNFTSFNLTNLLAAYFNKNCGLVAYDVDQETILNQKDPNWKTKNSSCPAFYTITLKKIGNGFISGSGSFTTGSNITLTATPDAGWEFSGWSPTSCTKSFVMPAKNLTCTATFSPLIKTVKQVMDKLAAVVILR